MAQQKRSTTAAKEPKRKKQPTTKAEGRETSPLAYEIVGLLLIAFAIIQLFEFGLVGRSVHSAAMFLLGNLHFFIPVLALVIAGMLIVRRRGIPFKRRILYGLLCIIGALTIFSHSMLFDQLLKANALLSSSILKETWRLLISTDGIVNRSNALGGGFIGALLYSFLHMLFGTTGSKVTAFVCLCIGIILLTGKSFLPMAIALYKRSSEKLKARPKKEPGLRQRKHEAKRQERSVHEAEIIVQQEPPIQMTVQPEPVVAPAPDVARNETSPIRDDEGDYKLPANELLQPPIVHDQSAELAVIQTNAKKLEQTLLSFGVRAKVMQVHLGPAVTKYEILPDIGVKVSKIVNLQDDLALALAAKDIRIEAPIPGKSAIGVEVPNQQIATVSLREVLEAPENNMPDEKLLIALGRDVAGKAILTELNKMPHLLVAGSTGSGKSVCINGIIISLLMRAKPHEVKLLMIDPKMVELSVYNGIPHLLAPVVTDPRKAAQALQKVVAEMERRYELFAETGTRNMEGYNAYAALNDGTPLPYIVVIVDELADLMLVAASDVETAIARLAQMARAAGIHLIIATQRPSVDVITGLIKANIPTRIAFAVSSTIDSRTILDMGGAERLLGRGDMLFLRPNDAKPTRIQGAFVGDKDVQRIVECVIAQQKAQYDETLLAPVVEEVAPQQPLDALYEEAMDYVIQTQTASISMLQRKFRIGYVRAARLMDQLEEQGIVGPADGSRPRQVLSTKR